MNSLLRVAVPVVALSLSLALGAGCGGASCVIGASSSCACPDGRTGAQVCRGDHTFGACVCMGATGGGSGGGSAGTGGSTGTGGGSTSGTKRVFVTETTYAGGTMGGLAGADQKCNLSAQAANLGGTWVAWASNGNTNAIDRVTGTGPWVVLGTTTTAFNNKANLATSPLVPINATEQGHTVSSFDGSVWTGTGSGGSAATSTCGGWSSGSSYGHYGSAVSTASWTSVGDDLCANTNRLYCFEL